MALTFSWLASGFPSTAQCADFNEQQRYFRGLRERGLFLIAEEYASARLAEPTLPMDESAMLTVELARTLADHGSYHQGDQRRELWAEADRAIRSTIAKQPRNPRRGALVAAIVELQVTRSRTFFWDAYVHEGNIAFREQALKETATSIHQLNETITSAAQQKAPTQAEMADGAMSLAERKQLLNALYLLRARCYLDFAELDPLDAEHQSTLNRATDDLRTLASRDRSTETSIEIGLLHLRCDRIKQDYESATIHQKQLNTILSPSPTATSPAASRQRDRDRLLAEQVRIERTRSRPDQALDLLRLRQQQPVPVSQELKALMVAVLLDAWTLANNRHDTTLSEQLFQQAEQFDGTITGKWRSWSRARIDRLREVQNLGSELASAEQAAKSAYQLGNTANAIKHYQHAIQIAKGKKLHPQTVDYSVTAASIHIQNQAWQPAIDLLSVAVQVPAGKKAIARADLLRCYCIGRLYQQTPSADARTQYEQALNQHRKNYAGTESAVEATWMLAVQQEGRLQWTTSIDLYREIPANHQHGDHAQLRIMILYEKILNRLRELDGPVSEWEEKAIQEINRIQQQYSPELASSQPPNLVQCELATRAARIALEHREHHYQIASQWLRWASSSQFTDNESNTNNRQQWKRLSEQTAQLKIVSLAGQGKLQEADAVLQSLKQADPTALLKILVRLTDAIQHTDSEHLRELGKLQQKAVAEMESHRDQLTAEQFQLLQRCHAQAFIATGDLPEAAAVYEKLIEAHPQDKALIQQTINVYLKRGQSEDLDRARYWWAKLESMAPPGTDSWFKARLQVANLTAKLGDAEKAIKLIKVTRTLYPTLGNEENQSAYARALNNMESTPSISD